jgi:Tol biopolymer transport system component
MTTKRMSEPDFDTLLTAWFEADARVREPEMLVDAALVRVHHTRRLPAWLLPEWWIPMQLSMQARAVPRLATTLLLVILLVAALVAIAIVGSTRRLPNPFGPAANGRVAYLSNGQIYAANPDGSNSIPLTFGVRSAKTPEWSRDGTRFAYSLISPKPGTDNPTHYGDIVVANADGSNLITIDRETVDPSPTVWSSDGRWLVYSKVVGPGDQIFIAASDGSSPPTRIGDPDTINWSPIFSPDDTKILYFRGDSHVAVMDRDGSNDRLLNTTAFTGVQSLVWHPDGNRVAVSAATTEANDIWFLSLDGTPERQVRTPGRTENGPSWSPDGNRLVYLTSFDGQVFTPAVADADGTNERRLPGVYSDINPAWSPDGRLIAVVNELGAVGYVELIDPDGERGPIRNESVAPADPERADRSAPVRWQRLSP